MQVIVEASIIDGVAGVMNPEIWLDPRNRVSDGFFISEVKRLPRDGLLYPLQPLRFDSLIHVTKLAQRRGYGPAPTGEFRSQMTAHEAGHAGDDDFPHSVIGSNTRSECISPGTTGRRSFVSRKPARLNSVSHRRGNA